MTGWKKNLTIIWLAQFLAISGFAFCMPIVPFYFQDLGITDSVQLKQYVALFGSLAPMTLAISSPIWGAIGDRFGRRLMLLRANFAASIVLTCMGLATSAEILLWLRAAQGIFTGTMSASQTLVSVNTPENKHGFALGALSSSLYSGLLFGSFIGGNFAEFFGYNTAFYLSGLLSFSSALLILFGTREHFTPPSRAEFSSEPSTSISRLLKEKISGMWVGVRPAAPILILVMAMSFTRQFDGSFLPLLVQEVNGKLEGSAAITGSLNAIGGVAGFFAGLIIGRISDRFSPPKVIISATLFAAVFTLPLAFAQGFILIFIARFFMIFFAGGLDPILQAWIAKATPTRLRGSVFGWAGSAKSLGWMMAPISSGTVAVYMDIRSIYILGAALYLMLIPILLVVVRYLGKQMTKST